MANQTTKISEAMENAAAEGWKRKNYFSFGDGEGLTATVSASGSLLRISQHFPGETKGFCVDPRGMPEPHEARKRLEELLLRSETTSSTSVIGPNMDLIADSITERPGCWIGDRWPSFQRRFNQGRHLEIQYLASKGKVYQILEFEEGSGASLTPLEFTTDFLIRDLDFVDVDNKFNMTAANDTTYYSCKAKGNRLLQTHSQGDKTIALHIQVLDGEEPLKVALSKEPANPTCGQMAYIESPENIWKSNASRTIILAYSVSILSGGQTLAMDIDKLPLLALKSVRETITELRREPSQPLVLAEDQTLNFVLKRNLEHILSVCSIPVLRSTDDEEPPIALTCGDAESHRVATAASFYAFETLLLAKEHFELHLSKLSSEEVALESDPDLAPSHIVATKKRIERVCKGHMRWLFECANPSGSFFSPHFWVDESKIEELTSSSSLPWRALVDTPFQLIKAGDYHSIFKDDTCQRVIQHIAKCWIADLDKVDNGTKRYAFARYDNKPTRSFYLTDHVLIWQAIKSVEGFSAMPEMTNDYSSKHIQEKILKMFTTQNPITKKQMVAIVRNPAHTRFLLRSKDSALFRAMDQGLFNEPGTGGSSTNCQHDRWHNKLQTWKNTIDCQVFHENNDDTKWNDPQRFALSVIMAHHLGKPINSRLPQDMLEQAISVLFRSSSHNGLFPGMLSKSHQPALYESNIMRDDYWGTTFEIPYTLWKYCSGVQDQDKSGGFTDTISMTHAQPEEPCHDIRPQESELSPSHVMKKNLPFNKLVIEKNIFQRYDDWLYNAPPFFGQSRSKKTNESKECPSESIRIDSVQTGAKTGGDSIRFNSSDRFQGLRVDFRRSKSIKKRDHSDYLFSDKFTTTASIKNIMGQARTRENAKKRLWVLASVHPIDRTTCLSTVSKWERRERSALKSFVERHNSFEKFFSETIIAEQNIWEMEFHLSFHILYSKPGRSVAEGQHPAEDMCIDFPDLLENSTPITLTKAVMSFRFESDFFDRYWTCRFLVADPEERSAFHEAMKKGQDGSSTNLYEIFHGLDQDEDDGREEMSSGDDFEDDTYNRINNKENRLDYLSLIMKQRRVLELKLFGRIVWRMNQSAGEILKETKQVLETRSNTLRRLFQATQKDSDSDRDEMLDHKDFLVESLRFREFQNCLRKVEGQFAENMTAINVWLNREMTREAEQPRWSFSNESRFRAVVVRETVNNERLVQTFTSYHSKVSNLVESTTKELELIRSYLDIMQAGINARDSEDIKRFTYVTVVFLPLGFATGMFSMSEAPKGSTLINMILTAIATLTLTVLTLVGYKFADSPRSREQLKERWKHLKLRLSRLMLWIAVFRFILRWRNSLLKGFIQQKNEHPQESNEGNVVGQNDAAANGERGVLPGETTETTQKWIRQFISTLGKTSTSNLKKRLQLDVESRGSRNMDNARGVDGVSIASPQG